MSASIRASVTACAFTLALLVPLGAVSAQDGSPPGEVPVDRIVAVVGNQPILWTDVLAAINTLQSQGQQVPTDSAELSRLSRRVLDQLIDEELLIQKAAAESIFVEDADVMPDVERTIRDVRARFQTEEEYRRQLAEAGFGTPAEYRSWLAERQRRAQIQRELFQQLQREGRLPPVPVTDTDISSFFEANRERLPQLPATVTFRQIVIAPRADSASRTAALAKAESLLVEIRRGGDFEQVAKRESMDPTTKELGGDLGWNRRGRMVPEFDRVMFSLSPGQVSPVFSTSFGFHIVKVDRVQPGEVKARHILIRPEVDSVDIEATRRLADSVAAAWRAGGSYDSLVARHHDPAEERIIPQAFARDSLPESYQTAIATKSVNEITDPFTIQSQQTGVPKFVVLQLTSVEPARTASLTDLRQRIRDQLSQERATRRLLDNLRRETFVSVRL
ncbi:MAG TPA: peptidylprolyl isomerase [Gemmatimonadaceae bacterium]|nr:peptidylprolyl isomerase [Gemmatimonadaceae bacterium]